MLMQNFKSAADLGITEPQFDALRKTLVLLETGKLVHDSSYRLDYEDEPKFSYSGKFNMRYWTEPSTECGTIACIGGTAELISDVKFTEYHSNAGLCNLFQPRAIPLGIWRDITPPQAATALRSYLTTGDARWDLAVAP